MNTTRTTPDRRTGGYTMAEILAVLLMVGIMASLAVPNMAGYVDRTKTRRALDHLVGDISYARMLAIQQARPVSVSLSTNASYSIDTLTASNGWSAMKSVNLGTEYTGVQLGGSVSRIVFSSRGLLTAQADTGYIKIMKNSVRDSAVISGAGRVYRGY